MPSAASTARSVRSSGSGSSYAAPKQNGYHGGITPQEVLVPLAVFTRSGGPELQGYAETPPGLPAWWEAAPAVAAPVRPPRKATTTKARPGRQQAELGFSGGKRASIPALLASPLFAVQREQAQRGYPGDDKTTAVLQAFADKGDTMTVLALANHLNLPASRVQGMLSTLRRVLNVDGTEVLEVEVQSGTVRVHWETLRLQFGLDAEGQS